MIMMHVVAISLTAIHHDDDDDNDNGAGGGGNRPFKTLYGARTAIRAIRDWPLGG